MTDATGQELPKAKNRRQTPEERQALLRYNQMMYGHGVNAQRTAAPKVDYGAPYLAHPSFKKLLDAFCKGGSASFEVTDKGRRITIATDGESIQADGKVLFYARPINKTLSNLLIDRTVALHFLKAEALVHLVFAVIRSLPEMEQPALTFKGGAYLMAGALMETGIETDGPNLLLGAFRTKPAATRS